MVIFYALYFTFSYVIPYGAYIFLLFLFVDFIVKVRNLPRKLWYIFLIYTLTECVKIIWSIWKGVDIDYTSSVFFIITPLLVSILYGYNYKKLLGLRSIFQLKVIILLAFFLKYGIGILTVEETDGLMRDFSTALSLGLNKLNVTDISFFILLQLFILDTKNSKKVFIILSFYGLIVALGLNKLLALEIVVGFVLSHFLSLRTLRTGLRAIFLIILALPYGLAFIFKGISSEDFLILDLLSSYRFSIWREALLNLDSLHSIYFGFGTKPFMFVDPFDTAQVRVEMSLHSAYIRLLYADGYLFYLIKISLFWYLLEHLLALFPSKVAVRFSLVSLLVLFTDGSLFYGWTYYVIFLVPLILIVSMDSSVYYYEKRDIDSLGSPEIPY